MGGMEPCFSALPKSAALLFSIGVGEGVGDLLREETVREEFFLFGVAMLLTVTLLFIIIGDGLLAATIP